MSDAKGDSRKESADPLFRQIISEEMGDLHGSGGFGGMNAREEEEFLLTYGPRKQRKEIKARRKEREKAEKAGRSDR